jgi:8-oxo-dGTP pyrophosphatase MutT (NUDIX family)
MKYQEEYDQGFYDRVKQAAIGNLLSKYRLPKQVITNKILDHKKAFDDYIDGKISKEEYDKLTQAFLAADPALKPKQQMLPGFDDLFKESTDRKKLPYRPTTKVILQESDGSIVARKGKGKKSLDLPGGGIDPGETPLQALKREVKEETGITPKNIKHQKTVKWDWPEKFKGKRGEKFRGENTHIFTADVGSKGKQTSDEGDDWGKVTSISRSKATKLIGKAMKEKGSNKYPAAQAEVLDEVKTAGAESAPNYGPAADTASSCSKCVHAQRGYCTLYDFDFESGYTCDSFTPNFSAVTDEGVPQVLEKYLPNKVAQYVNPYIRDVQLAHASKPLPKNLSELVAWLLSRGDMHRKMDAYYGAMNNMKKAMVANNTLPGSSIAPAGAQGSPMTMTNTNMGAGGAGKVSPNLKANFEGISIKGKQNGAAEASGVGSGDPMVADNGSNLYGVNLGGNYGVNVAAPTESVSQGVGNQQGMTVQASSAEKSAQQPPGLQWGKPGTPGYQTSYQQQGSFTQQPGGVWTLQQQQDLERGQMVNMALKNTARAMFNQQYPSVVTPQGQMINFTEGKVAAFIDGFMDKCAQYTEEDVQELLNRYSLQGRIEERPGRLPLPERVRPQEPDTGLTGLVKDVGALSLAGLPMTAAGMAVQPITGAVDRKSKVDIDNLLKIMEREGIPMERIPLPSEKHKDAPKWLDRISGNAAYDPSQKRIVGTKGMIDSPSILAHELGHARQSKPWLMANAGGKFAGGLASLLPLFTNDEDTSQTLSNVASLAYTPTVANELDASYRGYKGLRGAGRGRLGALAAFAGVPSYLAAALAPQLTHQLRKGFGTVVDKEASASSKQKKKISKVMREYKDGKLRSGSKKGPKVKNRDQAIAIALSEAGVSKK